MWLLDWILEFLYKVKIVWRFKCSKCGRYIYDLFKTDGEARLILHEEQCGGVQK